MWIDLLLVLIAVLPLFTHSKIRIANADKLPEVITDQPTNPPQARL